MTKLEKIEQEIAKVEDKLEANKLYRRTKETEEFNNKLTTQPYLENLYQQRADLLAHQQKIPKTKYQFKLNNKKTKGQEKIKRFKKRMADLKVIRRNLKEKSQNYSYINLELNKLRDVIKKIETNHLTTRQRKRKEENINVSIHHTRVNEKIITTENKLVKDLFNHLERISTNTNTDSIEYAVLYQIYYNNRKFKRFNKSHLKQLERLGWTFDTARFHRLSSLKTVSSYDV